MLSRTSSCYFFLCSLIIFLSIGISDFSGHDNQRVGQFAVGTLSILMLFVAAIKARGSAFFSRDIECLFTAVIVLGLISSLLSPQCEWGLVEVSLLFLCSAVAMAVAQQRCQWGAQLDQWLIVFVLLICSAKMLQFLVSTVTAFISLQPVVDIDLLLDGFSNRRFYGQFQTFTLPLLALPLLCTDRRLVRYGVFLLLSLWWMIAITGGTRGTWLGMAVAMGLMLWFGPAGRRWAAWQASAAAVGLLSYLAVFGLLANGLGITIENSLWGRISTTLSGREALWSQAWSMIKAHPLLGAGPMHFADTWNPAGAHPHQAILQWASEWGIPSTLCVAGLALYGLVATARVMHRRKHSTAPIDQLRLCLAASLVAALSQAMVDGVIVMPNSQLWLAIVIGWLLAIHERTTPLLPASPLFSRLWLASLVVSAGLLLHIIVRDLPATEAREQQFAHDFGGAYQPRFWMQGVIARPSQIAPEAGAGVR